MAIGHATRQREGYVGRAERPLDPDSGPVARFAHDLRALRYSAGSPTYRVLARRTYYSVTSLSQAAAGNSLPSLPITLAFVEACGGDLQEWRHRWHELAAMPAAAGAAGSGHDTGTWERAGMPPRPARHPVANRPDMAPGAPHGDDPPTGTGSATRPDAPAEPAIRRPRLLDRHRVVVMIALAVALAGAVAVMAAGPGRSGRALTPGSADSSAASSAAPSSAPDPGAPRYVATVAADCPHVPGTSALAYSPAQPVWSTGTLGGWSGDGCYGEFFYQSQSGASKISPNYVEWTLHGMDATPAGCLISIFVADSPHSAGLARYYVSTLENGAPHVIADRVIDQRAHHGDWVGTGPYKVDNGWLRVDVHAQDPRRREITAGTIHVYCPAG